MHQSTCLFSAHRIDAGDALVRALSAAETRLSPMAEVEEVEVAQSLAVVHASAVEQAQWVPCRLRARALICLL